MDLFSGPRIIPRCPKGVTLKKWPLVRSQLLVMTCALRGAQTSFKIDEVASDADAAVAAAARVSRCQEKDWYLFCCKSRPSIGARLEGPSDGQSMRTINWKGVTSGSAVTLIGSSVVIVVSLEF